jgi:hypothetical protein
MAWFVRDEPALDAWRVIVKANDAIANGTKGPQGKRSYPDLYRVKVIDLSTARAGSLAHALRDTCKTNVFNQLMVLGLFA